MVRNCRAAQNPIFVFVPYFDNLETQTLHFVQGDKQVVQGDKEVVQGDKQSFRVTKKHLSHLLGIGFRDAGFSESSHLAQSPDRSFSQKNAYSSTGAFPQPHVQIEQRF